MTKHGVFAADFLEGFSGVWLCDGASDYNQATAPDGVERAGCWSHARRYLFEARKDNEAVGPVLLRAREETTRSL